MTVPPKDRASALGKEAWLMVTLFCRKVQPSISTVEVRSTASKRMADPPPPMDTGSLELPTAAAGGPRSIEDEGTPSWTWLLHAHPAPNPKQEKNEKNQSAAHQKNATDLLNVHPCTTSERAHAQMAPPP